MRATGFYPTLLIGLSALGCESTRPQVAEPTELPPPPETKLPPPGIRVYARTAGRNLDPDGYLVTLDSGRLKTIAVNDSVMFDTVAAGSHALELTGVAKNCWTSDTPAAINVSDAGVTRAVFDILCAGPIPDHVEIAFEDNGEVYGIRADGTGITDLTGTGHLSSDPAWSPDGSRLAFVSNHDDDHASIWVVNADGTSLRQLTRGPKPGDREPAWSPDGTKIAFRRGPGVVSQGDADLYIVEASGGGAVHLTASPQMHDDSPAWSPNGSRIAFERVVSFNYSDLFVLDLRDSSEINLTNDRDYNIINREPSWSPDGRSLVFRRGVRGSDTWYDIWLRNADGSQRALIAWPDVQMDPAWSPDGTIILFTSFAGPGGDSRGRATIFAVTLASAQVTELTAGGSASWRPRPPGGAAGR